MNTKKADFLLEIGCEELPADQQHTLAAQLRESFSVALDKERASYEAVRPFSTPRRLAIIIQGLGLYTEEKKIRREGPFCEKAFDQNNRPTAAGLGFAQSCGVTLESLGIFSTPKGSRLVFEHIEPGKSIQTLLPDIVEAAVYGLKLKKTMCWADHTLGFIRPVRWVVALLDKVLLPLRLFQQVASVKTRGHRVLQRDKEIILTRASDYVDVLRQEGQVLVDYQERKAKTQDVIEKAALGSGQALICSELLEEVVGLTEWPIGILAQFESSALSLPSALLTTVIATQLKSFPVKESTDNLCPCFVVVTQVAPEDIDTVRRGYERVIRARLADARFFLEKDLTIPLSARLPALKNIIFEKALGSLHDKAQRTAALASFIAKAFAVSEQHSVRAAWLTKCDLLSDVVTEFPVLQGVMGAYYAEQEGLDSAVCQAIFEHYLPRFSQDELPVSPVGKVVALAHHLDTLVGMLSVHGVPSGEKDPYGMRRTALGILRILMTMSVPISVRSLLTQGGAAYLPAVISPEVIENGHAFLLQRFAIWQQTQGYSIEIVRSVLSVMEGDLNCYEASARLQAVKEFLSCTEAQSLLALHKRIHNLVSSYSVAQKSAIDEQLLVEPTEQAVYAALMQTESNHSLALQQGDYLTALRSCLTLNTPVAQLFDQVMILDKVEAVCANRLALLGRLSLLLNKVAQLSQLSL